MPCRKVKDLEYTTIAVGHGPILRYNIPELVSRYKKWSEAVGKATASAAVLYSSDYGFSDRSVSSHCFLICRLGSASCNLSWVLQSGALQNHQLATWAALSYLQNAQ